MAIVKWLYANETSTPVLDGLYGGLITSVFTAAIFQYYNIHNKTANFQQWLNLGPTDIYTVLAYIEKQELVIEWGCSLNDQEKDAKAPLYYLSPPSDGNANAILTHLLRQMGFRYPLRKTVGSHYPFDEIYRDNLVIVCMPHRNKIARVFLGLAHELYVKNHDLENINIEDAKKYLDDSNADLDYLGVQKNKISGKWEIRDFGSSWLGAPSDPENSEYAPADLSMILKMPNPFNKSAQILVVAGLRGIGTYGAALFLYDNVQKMGNFKAKKSGKRVGSEPQAHIIDIAYNEPHGEGNILDSDITRKTCKTSILLDELTDKKNY